MTEITELLMAWPDVRYEVPTHKYWVLVSEVGYLGRS